MIEGIFINFSSYTVHLNTRQPPTPFTIFNYTESTYI